jgi:hypothetical protein
MIPKSKVGVKKTTHKCVCAECHEPIIQGSVRLGTFFGRYYHPQCFVNLVESIPDIETLWKNAVTKNVLGRITGGKR